MKTNLLFIFSLCAMTCFAQTNLAPNGNLESWSNATTLDDWTIENNVTQNTTDTAEGSSSASFSITTSASRPSILAKVPLVAGSEYVISYKFRYVSDNFNGSHPISAKISRQGSAATASNNSFATNNDWVQKSFNFEPDETGDYDLSFSTTTFDEEGFEVLIDDITVFDAAVLNIENSNLTEKFSFFPTITEGLIYVNQSEQFDVSNLSIFDTNGRKQNVQIENNTINLSALATGMYFINLSTNTQSITKRVIKK